jgi:uncharacterized protein (DUF1015 family)
MAIIYPFRPWRYNPAVVRLDDVVTQPYDKISPAMQQAYYQSSPYNIVRIILGLPELFDAERGESVYSRAARDFRDWREQGILIQEKTPCVYAYAQRFAEPGSGELKERRGFIALGKLQDYSEQVVFRHEQTLAKPKGDRKRLLEATRAHFGQIFMLYSDPARSVEKVLYDGNGTPDAEVTDEYGVQHRLWRISDAATIRLLCAVMRDKKLIIADGHHRYETALAYAKEHAGHAKKPELSVNELPYPAYPEAAVMMTFVNMDSEGLSILPTHRVVHGVAGFDGPGFLAKTQEFFTAEKVEETAGSDLTRPLAGEAGTAYVLVLKNGAWLLRPKAEAVAPMLKGMPERQKKLDLTVLHKVLLEHVLGLTEENIREQTNLRYVREAADAVEQVRRGDANAAILTRPVTMEQLREVAYAGDVMPQKSTDFYPKLVSGLTIYALD